MEKLPDPIPDPLSDSLSDVLHELTATLAGLYFPSEAEFPWEIRLWVGPPPTDTALRTTFNQLPTAPIAAWSPQEFLAQVERRCRGYGPEGQTMIQGHRTLIEIYQRHFQGVHIKRIGNTSIDLLMWGHPSPTWAQSLPEPLIVALHTRSIET